MFSKIYATIASPGHMEAPLIPSPRPVTPLTNAALVNAALIDVQPTVRGAERLEAPRWPGSTAKCRELSGPATGDLSFVSPPVGDRLGRAMAERRRHLTSLITTSAN